MLARAAWLAASLLLLTATPTLSVETVQRALDGIGAPIAAPRDVSVASPVPLPVDLGVHAQLAPRPRVEVTVRVLGAGGAAAPGNGSDPGPARMSAAARPTLNAPSQVAAVVAEQLREDRDGGPAFSLLRLDAALGDWRSAEQPDRLLVGRGELTVRDAAGNVTRCGLTAAALYTAWGEHLRVAVRAVDPRPACVPLTSSAPRGLLQPDGDGWRSEVRGARGQVQSVRTGQGERSVPLDYRVGLADGTTYAFTGALDALPVEPGGGR